MRQMPAQSGQAILLQSIGEWMILQPQGEQKNRNVKPSKKLTGNSINESANSSVFPLPIWIGIPFNPKQEIAIRYGNQSNNS